MNDCIFCKIITGEIPSYKLYEDESCIVILDRYPRNTGHALVIPKAHIETIYGLTPEQGSALFHLTQKTALRIQEMIHPDGLNILQNNGTAAGQAVNHFHIHVIPRHEGDGNLFNRDPITPTQEELLTTAETLRF